MAEKPSIVRDAAHILVLLVLLLVLLVVVTKFKIVHPSAIPGWQGVYCTYVEQKHSVVGFVYGADGAGDPEQLVQDLTKNRPLLRTELVRLQDATPALLSRYEVIVLERSRTVPIRVVSVLEGYLDSGGTLVWTGDSLSHQVLDERDFEEARQLNSTTYRNWANSTSTGKDYYSWFLETYGNVQGFGGFGDKFLGGYLRTERASSTTFLKPVIREHLLLSGIASTPLEQGGFLGVVNQNDDVDMLASIEHSSEVFPGILEKKYVGRVLYFAFPLEALGSKTFIDNVFDYLVTC